MHRLRQRQICFVRYINLVHLYGQRRTSLYKFMRRLLGTGTYIPINIDRN